MTLTLAPQHATTACPHCGHSSETISQELTALEAQQKIEDLQAQVKILTEKATAAVDKWADYEDELRLVRAKLLNEPPPIEIVTPTDPQPPSPPTKISNRLSSFLTSRKSTPNFNLPSLPLPSLPSFSHSRSPSTPQPKTPSELELTKAVERETALREEETKLREREQKLRVVAEGKLNEASGELEDLTVQLFQQANEMVATERKERAKLEARVAVLERRDGEKRMRLERLEGAVGRIERVRGLLNQEKL